MMSKSDIKSGVREHFARDKNNNAPQVFMKNVKLEIKLSGPGISGSIIRYVFKPNDSSLAATLGRMTACDGLPPLLRSDMMMLL